MYRQIGKTITILRKITEDIEKKNIKLLIAGGRDFSDYERLKQYMDKLRKKYIIDEIVCGMARGADMLGYKYAIENNIKVIEFPADWDKYGKRAGYLRNYDMGKYCDNGFIFWNKSSKGTKHMIDIMNKLNKKIVILYY